MSASAELLVYVLHRSPFTPVHKSYCTVPVSGISDANVVAENFASHFAKVCTPNADDGTGKLKAEYDDMRGSYCGPSYDSKCDFTAELVETVIAKMKRGKQLAWTVSQQNTCSTAIHWWPVC